MFAIAMIYDRGIFLYVYLYVYMHVKSCTEWNRGVVMPKAIQKLNYFCVRVLTLLQSQGFFHRQRILFNSIIVVHQQLRP
jgi:hypothetical protein